MNTSEFRILLVEDDEADAFLIKDLLHEANRANQVEWVTSLEPALLALRTQAFDVCLLDFRLGKHTGLDLLRAIREEQLPTPVVLLSGEAGHEVDLEAMQAGAADFIPKDALSARALERTLRYTRAHREVQMALQQGVEQLEQRIAERTAALVEANRAMAAEVEKRREIEEDLRASDVRKDEFLAMLGHELRNPLSVVVGGLQLLERDASPMEQLIPVMARQVRHLSRLVDDLLDVARIRNGKMVLQTRPVAIRDILEHAIALIQPLMEERHHSLVRQMDGSPYILGDATRLEQIFGNVLNNAAKYMQDAGQLRIVVEPTDRDVTIRVIDTGQGMTRELQERVFQLFVQSENIAERQHGGLGIGLHLVKQLVELHDGTVTLHSDGPGQGTEVTIRFPTCAPPLCNRMPRDSVQTMECQSILIVDDNCDLANTLELQLVRLGHRVRCAHSAEAGIAAAQNDAPEIMIVDIGLPDRSGLEVARELRNLPIGQHLLLISISGFGQRGFAQQALAAGFDAHLVKPVHLDRLLRIMARRGVSDHVASENCSASARPKALVVDDRRDGRYLAEMMLRQMGFDVRGAENGTVAVATIDEFHPEIVLCDLHLGTGPTGFELARNLRARSGNDLYLIAMSGSTSGDYQIMAIESGFDLFVAKPLDFGRLLNQLPGHLVFAAAPFAAHE